MWSGYIPAPMIFGALIDSACRLWERGDDSPMCPGGTGSCLLFDTDRLRRRMFGVSFGIQFIQLTFAVLLYLAIRRRKFNIDNELPSRCVEAAAVDGDAKGSQTAEELTLLETNNTTANNSVLS